MALSIAEKGNNQSTTGWVLRGAGIFGFLGGLYTTSIAITQEQFFGGLIVSGAGLVTYGAGAIIGSMSQRRLKEALQTYEGP
ncbi:MAG TPA: hypothetical protein DCE41_04100 [Cytophagales bacterium]|nr:hypothetical protein [Cytophagales bacterium]